MFWTVNGIPHFSVIMDRLEFICIVMLCFYLTCVIIMNRSKNPNYLIKKKICAKSVWLKYKKMCDPKIEFNVQHFFSLNKSAI